MTQNRADMLYNNYMKAYEIKIEYDEETAVWVASNYEIPIVLESGSLDLLMERVRAGAPELMEANGIETTDYVLHFSVERYMKAS